jgi:hypothetical protein
VTDDQARLTCDVSENKRLLQERMYFTADLVMVNAAIDTEKSITVCYLAGMIDSRQLDQMLLLYKDDKELLPAFREDAKVHTFEEVAECLASGMSVLLFDEAGYGVAIDTLGVQLRSVEEPASEAIVKGPRSGFTESLQNNIALLRYHCPSPSLKVEYRKIGQVSKTKLAVISVGGISSPEILQEVHQRLDEIPIDAVLASNYIEEWITDNSSSLFPLLESTERPDRVIGALMEGRIAILVQGTPFVLIVPFVFLQAFQVSEDYAWNFYIGSIMRLTRLFCGMIGLLLPAFYVATVTFHHELVPTTLLQSIASSKEPVPFPAVLESFMMMVAFEIIREAGVRMPKQVGQAVSIVGALILGQAAVEA